MRSPIIISGAGSLGTALHTPRHRDTVPPMMAAKPAPAARKRIASLRLAVAAFVPTLALAALAFSPAAADSPPGRKLELGFEERVRSENWDNSADFNKKVVDARHQWRFRTRAWAKLSAGANELMIGFNDESRRLSTPHVALTLDEIVIETLYLDHRFSDGASIRVGRQNLTKGDGFILMDGSPLDGSRVAYFNAVDLGWTAGKSRLDLLVISDPYRDEYLPRIHDRKKSLLEWDENALGLYWTDAGRAGTTLDAYYFYKTETGDTRALTNAARQPDRMFHTLGGRVARDWPKGWSVKAELAGQAGGQQPTTDIRAWGGQASVKRTFAQAMKPSLLIGWTGLSGDNPATKANEGWDPLFSRYPKWSELYIYTQGSERGPAYWTNLSMWQAEFRLTPVKPLDLRATYYRMAAFHLFPGKPSIYAFPYFGDLIIANLTRGDLYEARADLKVNDNWRGHVVGEYMKPGGFYIWFANEPGWFFRAEVSCSFKQTLSL